MTGRMQVLVDGKWVDVGGVQSLDGFTLDDQPIIDEAVIEPTPTSFTMEMTLTEGSASELRRALDLAEQYQREERARRRLWLRYPYRMPR